MLVLGIALVVVALASTMEVPAFVLWCFGVTALGIWAGRKMAESFEKARVSKDEKQH